MNRTTAAQIGSSFLGSPVIAAGEEWGKSVITAASASRDRARNY
jgi:hypothetical protein